MIIIQLLRFMMTSETEALKNFKEIPLRNFQCLSGGKKCYWTIQSSFRPSLEILEIYLKF